MPVRPMVRAGAADTEDLVDLVVCYGLKTIVAAVVGLWRVRDRRIERDLAVEAVVRRRQEC